MVAAALRARVVLRLLGRRCAAALRTSAVGGRDCWLRACAAADTLVFASAHVRLVVVRASRMRARGSHCQHSARWHSNVGQTQASAAARPTRARPQQGKHTVIPSCGVVCVRVRQPGTARRCGCARSRRRSATTLHAGTTHPARVETHAQEHKDMDDRASNLCEALHRSQRARTAAARPAVRTCESTRRRGAVLQACCAALHYARQGTLTIQ